MYHEHEVILDAARIALSLENSWETNVPEYQTGMSGLLDFFKEYSDRYHHIKEEEILFPALRKTDAPAVISLIDELADHHEQFRGAVEEISNDFSVKNYPAAQQKLQRYMNDLQDHIAAENEELFPMADSLFNDDELEKMYHKCIDQDTALGAARKQELENFVKNFKLRVNEAAK